MSALPPKAHMAERDRDVRFVPKHQAAYSITSSARASRSVARFHRYFEMLTICPTSHRKPNFRATLTLWNHSLFHHES
jgi:hypothetical protein